MPYNIFGEWIEPKNSCINKSLVKNKPMKVQVVKRKDKQITMILNPKGSTQEFEGLLSALKKQLGCGGSIKAGSIEIQGEHREVIEKYLKIKS